MNIGWCFRWLSSFIISDLFTIRSLAGWKQWSTFATWVSTFIATPRGSSLGDSIFWMTGGIARASSHIGSGRVDVAWGWKPGTLGGLETMGFFFVHNIASRVVFCDHRPCKREVVFPIWEWFHLASSTWQWGHMEYPPHRALLFGDVDRCDMILNHWNKQGRSTVGIDWACWGVYMGKCHALKHYNISHSHGIEWGHSTIEIKDASQENGKRSHCFVFLVEYKMFLAGSIFFIRPIDSWARELGGHEIFIYWHICPSSRLTLDTC